MVSQRWARPEWHETIDSTNREMLEDPRPGRVVVADHQSAGLGRRGRQWTAPQGMSLAVSVAVVAPQVSLVGWVPLLTGLAVVRALGDHSCAVKAGLKWPNDVLLPPPSNDDVRSEPGKVCGVLAHARGEVIVIGAGLNIDQTGTDLPVDTATSWRLARGGQRLPPSARQEWLGLYLGHLDSLLQELPQDPQSVFDAYRSACWSLGRDIVLELADDSRIQGVVEGINDSGALLVDEGRRRTAHHAGDVVHLRPRQEPR